jgi:hypothetical protein
LNVIYATACGEFQAAIDIAQSAAAGSLGDEPVSLGSMLVPPLALTGQFQEALHYADAMWRAWEGSGRATAGWLWFPAATAALALGLSGDRKGSRLWRQRMTELAGPRNAYRLRTASSAHFVDARLAVHTGDLTDALAIVEAAFSSRVPGHRYRVFALAAAAELAVVAGLPDASRYVDAATKLATENRWASACLARGRGRYANDPAALRESIAAWDYVGARFESAYTLDLLSALTDSLQGEPFRATASDAG